MNAHTVALMFSEYGTRSPSGGWVCGNRELGGIGLVWHTVGP